MYMLQNDYQGVISDVKSCVISTTSQQPLFKIGQTLMCSRQKHKYCAVETRGKNEWNSELERQEGRTCLRNCCLDCAANVRNVDQTGKDFSKVQGQCAKMYEFEVYSGSGNTIN